MKPVRWVLSAGAGVGWLSPAAKACATCFGRSDSALAQGLNMGILFLLGVLLVVLGGLVTFFVYLARRAATSETAGSATAGSEPGGFALKQEFRPRESRTSPAGLRAVHSRSHARVHH